jgi:hypothetical protein
MEPNSGRSCGSMANEWGLGRAHRPIHPLESILKARGRAKAMGDNSKRKTGAKGGLLLMEIAIDGLYS